MFSFWCAELYPRILQSHNDTTWITEINTKNIILYIHFKQLIWKSVIKDFFFKSQIFKCIEIIKLWDVGYPKLTILLVYNEKNQKWRSNSDFIPCVSLCCKKTNAIQYDSFGHADPFYTQRGISRWILICAGIEFGWIYPC